MRSGKCARIVHARADSVRPGDVLGTPDGDMGGSVSFSEIIEVRPSIVQLPSDQQLDVLVFTVRRPDAPSEVSPAGLIVIHAEAIVQLCLDYEQTS